MFARQFYALAGAQEPTVGKQGLGRQCAVSEQRARAIKIPQYQVEQFRPFQQTCLDLGPVLAADNIGRRVQLPGTARAALAVIEVEGGALVTQNPLDFLFALLQRLWPEIAKAAEQVLPLGLYAAVSRMNV